MEATQASDCHGALCGYRLGLCRTPEVTLQRSWPGGDLTGHQRGGRQPARPRRPNRKKIHSSGHGKKK
jgi:hypothetical protein